MSRFLIEVPHDSDRVACTRAVEVFLRTGSHFLTHADWGCRDGEHKAWLIVEVDGKDEARNTIPPEFRAGAKIVKLNSFSWSDIDPTGRRRAAAEKSAQESTRPATGP
jgi:hypothetical protein